MAKSKSFNLTEEQLQILVSCLRTNRPTKQSIALYNSVNKEIEPFVKWLCAQRNEKHLLSLGIVEQTQSNFWICLTFTKKPLFATSLSSLMALIYCRSAVNEYRFAHPPLKNNKKGSYIHLNPLDELSSQSQSNTTRELQQDVENCLVNKLTINTFLQQLMEQLQPDNRTALNEHHFEGIDVDVLATLRQLSEDTLKQRIRRDCQNLEEQYQNQYNSLFGRRKTQRETQLKKNRRLFNL